MSKKEKLIARLLSLPKDFTYDEMKTLLGYLGFEEDNKGAHPVQGFNLLKMNIPFYFINLIQAISLNLIK